MRAVVISADIRTQEAIARALRGAAPDPDVTTTDDLRHWLDRARTGGAPTPDLIVLDDPAPDEAATAAEAMPDAVVIAVVPPSDGTDRNTVAALTNAGARGILTAPVNIDEAARIIRRALDLAKTGAHHAPTSTARSKTVSVWAAKGGVGVSLLAVNLAAALARAAPAPDRIALLDFDVHYGCDALFLRVAPTRTMAEFAQEPAKTPETFADYLLAHPCGLRVLAAPVRPELGDLVGGTEARTMLDLASKTCDTVVVDTPCRMSDVTLAALDAADTVLLVCATDVAAVANTRRALNVMRELGHEPKLRLVLNRANAGGPGMDTRDVERALDAKIAYEIPSDGRVAVGSINTGKPFVIHMPRTRLAKAVRNIAAALAGGTARAPRGPRLFR